MIGEEKEPVVLHKQTRVGQQTHLTAGKTEEIPTGQQFSADADFGP